MKRTFKQSRIKGTIPETHRLGENSKTPGRVKSNSPLETFKIVTDRCASQFMNTLSLFHGLVITEYHFPDDGTRYARLYTLGDKHIMLVEMSIAGDEMEMRSTSKPDAVEPKLRKLIEQGAVREGKPVEH